MASEQPRRVMIAVVVIGCLFLITQKFEIKSTLIPTSTQLELRTTNKRKLNSSLNIDFSAAKKQAQDLLSLIRARYELDGPIGSQFFLAANNMAGETWCAVRYIFFP